MTREQIKKYLTRRRGRWTDNFILLLLRVTFTFYPIAPEAVY